MARRVALCALVCVSCAPVVVDSGEGEGDVGEGEGEFGGEGEGEVVDVGCDIALVADSDHVVEGAVWQARAVCQGTPHVIELDGPAGMVLLYDELTFAPTKSDAGRVTATLRVPDTGEEFAFVVDVDDATFDADNTAIVDVDRYVRESGLPVLFLNGRPQSESETPAEVVYGGVHHAVEARLRGASSLGYPKNSYSIDFNDAPFNDEASGFVDREKIILTTTFDDLTAVRQRLAFEVWNRFSDVTPHTKIQTQSVVVYIDGVYEGVYLMCDQVNRDLFKRTLGLPKTGNLYKSVNHDANFRLTYAFADEPKGFLGEGYELRDEPAVPVGQWTDLTSLVEFAATASDEEFAAGVADRVSVDDVIDWWVFVTLIEAGDSAGKNAYLYAVDGGVFRYAPWDFNHSFGQAWETSRTVATDPADYLWANELFTRLHGLEPFASQMRARYHDVVNASLDEAAIVALFDRDVAETAEARAKDALVWRDDYEAYFGRPETPDEEVAWARAWIVERWAARRVEFP